MQADDFHWVSVLIGTIERDGNRKELLEPAHHLADDWDEHARADGERYADAHAEAPDTDQAWAQPLKPIKGVSGHRDLYLTLAQRQSLIRHAREDAQPFMQALAELPLRVGSVAALRVGDYDKRNKLLTTRKDKSGAGRTIPLPPTVAKLIADQARQAAQCAAVLTLGW